MVVRPSRRDLTRTCRAPELGDNRKPVFAPSGPTVTVWVFINDKLVIDLGGVHYADNAQVDIDARAVELGLEKGKVYPFDMFQNERHAFESNFRANTTLNFVDCGTIVPDVVIPK